MECFFFFFFFFQVLVAPSHATTVGRRRRRPAEEPYLLARFSNVCEYLVFWRYRRPLMKKPYIYVFGVTYKRNTYQNVIAWSFACITLTHRSSHSIHQQLPLIPGPLRPIMLVPLIPPGQFWKPESGKQTDERLILVNETRFNTANKTWKNLTFWKDKFWAIVSTQLFFRQFTNKKSCEFTFFYCLSYQARRLLMFISVSSLCWVLWCSLVLVIAVNKLISTYQLVIFHCIVFWEALKIPKMIILD